MSTERNSIRITGSTIKGSAFGIGDVTLNSTGAGDGAALADLRSVFAARADEIIALGPDDAARDDLRHELRKIRQEIDAAEPDGATVRSRWRSVLAVLGTTVATSANVAQITDLVLTVFQG